ncbi:MAG: PilZ domain-containing protein, partial [Planctomycetota bacterium]
RPKRSARRPAQVETRPPGVQTGAVGGPGRPGGEARSAEGRPSETCDEARNADQRDRPSSGVVTRTTRPGITQAAKLGSDKAGTKREFTTHLHRDQDRVNIRDFIDVSYRFLLPNRPELARDVYSGRLVDISLTGAQVEGPVPEGVPSDELTSDEVVVKSEMALPYVEGPLVTDSQLAWVRPGRVAGCSLGLDFIDVTDDQLKLIRGFLIGLQSPTRTKFRRGR